MPNHESRHTPSPPSEHELEVRRIESNDLSNSAGPYLRRHGPSISDAIMDLHCVLFQVYDVLGIPEMWALSNIPFDTTMTEVARIITWGTRLDVPVQNLEMSIEQNFGVKLDNFAEATMGQVVSEVALKLRRR